MDGPVWQYHVDTIAKLRDALESLRRPHLAVEGDPWFSCPKHPEYAGTQKPDICDCGADDHNAIIDKALAL